MSDYKDRTGEEIKQAVKLYHINSWSPYSCSICGSDLFYWFYEDGRVTFDSSCDCVLINSPERPCSWDEVAKCYNSFRSKEKNAKYFGFSD